MLEWLSDWLKQILAVVLLASVVDLLMPGKSFHRYMRFVLGLLILLAMLGPVLKLVRDDPSVLLENGMRGWEAASRRAAPDMPGLEEIQRRAEELRARRDMQAADLAARGLEAEIEAALARHPGMPAARADVMLGGHAAAGGPAIQGVTITLSGAEPEAAETDREDGTSGAIGAIAPIERVATGVELGQAPAADGSGPATDKRASNAGREAPPEAAAAVRAIVHQGWGVEPERIIVLAPAAQS